MTLRCHFSPPSFVFLSLPTHGNHAEFGKRTCKGAVQTQMGQLGILHLSGHAMDIRLYTGRDNIARLLVRDDDSC